MALLAALFALNHESLSGMMMLFLGMLLIADIRKKAFKKAVIPFYIINVIELLWILFCPGNANRRHVETVAYFPKYGEYSVARMVYEGICSLLRGMFDVRGMAILTIAFTILLLYLAFLNKRPLAVKLLTALVLFYESAKLLYSAVDMIFQKKLRSGRFLWEYRDNPRAAVLGCVMLVCFLIALYGNTAGLKEQIFVFGALFSGMATKLILGFSLAFLASGERTSLFLAFALMLLALFLIEKYESHFAVFYKRWFVAGLILMNTGLFLWNYFFICRDTIW